MTNIDPNEEVVARNDDDAPVENLDGIRNITMFRLMTSLEIELTERLMQAASGLKRHQIAVNSWGFPAIPIPEVRRHAGSDIIQTIPRDTETRYYGHPIFWIDPDLTTFDRTKESEESWSIRMFYLIFGMGMWTEDYKWVDYLVAQDVTFEEHDVLMYRNNSISGTLWENIPFLEESDLMVPLQKVQDAYNIAIDTCQDILASESQSFRLKQIQAVSHAKKFIGDDPYDRDIDPDDDNGMWKRAIWPAIGTFVDDYEERLSSNQYADLSDMIEPCLKAFQGFQNLLVQMDKITATLSVTVIRNCEDNLQSYTQMLTFMGITNFQVEYRSEQYLFNERVSDAFSVNRYPGTMQEIARDCFETYVSCWRRMRLALVNNYQMSMGLEPIVSYAILEVDLVSIEQAQRKLREEQEERSMLFRREDGELQ